MIRPIIFKSQQAISDGAFLSGHASFSRRISLTSALLTAIPPTGSENLVLTLLINEEPAVGGVFVVPPGASEYVATLTFNLRVPAGSIIRWQATYAGSAGTRAVQVSITMAGVYADPQPHPRLRLAYYDGSRLPLYEYDALNKVWGVLIEGFPYARLDVNEEAITFQINGGVVMQFTPDNLIVDSLQAVGSTLIKESPRLEFLVGDTRIASITASGVLVVSRVRQEVLAELTEDDAAFFRRFEIWIGSSLVAVLAANGLFLDPAVDVQQEAPPPPVQVGLTTEDGLGLLFEPDGQQWVAD